MKHSTYSSIVTRNSNVVNGDVATVLIISLSVLILLLVVLEMPVAVNGVGVVR